MNHVKKGEQNYKFRNTQFKPRINPIASLCEVILMSIHAKSDDNFLI